MKEHNTYTTKFHHPRWSTPNRNLFRPTPPPAQSQPEPKEENKLLDVKEVAERLGVSTRTVERLKADSEISFIRIGRCCRFKPEHVDEYIAKQERKAVRTW